MVVRQAAQYNHYDPERELVPLIIAAISMCISAVCQIYLINATMTSGKVHAAPPCGPPCGRPLCRPP